MNFPTKCLYDLVIHLFDTKHMYVEFVYHICHDLTLYLTCV